MVELTMSRSTLRMAGAGVLIFGLLALAMLYSQTDPGEHPLAAEPTVDLCGKLGADVWDLMAYPALDPVVRVPESAGDGDSMCAYEIDPVDPSDRWARVARGEDADRVQQIAVVSLATTAYLRHRGPSVTAASYFETFNNELRADGWERQVLVGPWSRGNIYSTSGDRTATLFEDEGVVVWIASEGVEAPSLEVFSRAVAARLRE